MSLRCYLLSCVLLLAALPVAADTLWLDNGDRLSGKIQLVSGNTLVMRTEYAGEVAVQVSHIRTLESDGPLLIKDENNAQHSRRLQASSEPGQVLLVSDEAEATPYRISQLRRMMAPQPAIKDWRWSGTADLSLELENTESKKRDLDVDMSAEARHADWRHVLGAEYQRDHRNDRVSRHRWELDYAFSWFLTEKWFWENRLRYKRDHLEEISRQVELGTGLGYEWWNNAFGRFETAARLVHLRMDLRDSADRSTNGLGVGMGYRRYLLGKRVEYRQKAKAVLPDDPAVSYMAEAQVGLHYLLNEWASLSLSADWEYIDSADETALNDTVYKLGVGVSW